MSTYGSGFRFALPQDDPFAGSNYGDISPYLSDRMTSGESSMPLAGPYAPPSTVESGDSLDQQISDTRGALARQRATLEDAVKAQFNSPYPARVSPKFGTRDLAWAIPALALAVGGLGGREGPAGAASLVSGALQGKMQDADSQTQDAMGAFAYGMRGKAAQVQAAQSQVEGSQSDLQSLLTQKHYDLTYGLGQEKLKRTAIENARKALYDPSADVSGKQTALGTLQSMGVATPADYEQAGVKTYKQGSGEADTALKDAKTTGQQIKNEFAPKVFEEQLRSSGIKDERMISSTVDAYSKAHARDTMLPYNVNIAKAKYNMDEQHAGLYAQTAALLGPKFKLDFDKAHATIAHLSQLDQIGWARLGQQDKFKASDSLNKGITALTPEIDKLTGDITYLQGQLQFLPPDASDPKTKQVFDAIAEKKTQLEALKTQQGSLREQAGQARTAMGFNPDGSVIPPAEKKLSAQRDAALAAGLDPAKVEQVYQSELAKLRNHKER